MKEKLLELVVWGDMEEKGFAIRLEGRGVRPKSFTLTKQDEYEVLLAVVKAVAMRFDSVSGAVMTTEDVDADTYLEGGL